MKEDFYWSLIGLAIAMTKHRVCSKVTMLTFHILVFCYSIALSIVIWHSNNGHTPLKIYQNFWEMFKNYSLGITHHPDQIPYMKILKTRPIDKLLVRKWVLIWSFILSNLSMRQIPQLTNINAHPSKVHSSDIGISLCVVGVIFIANVPFSNV
jgi:hypothetical protein